MGFKWGFGGVKKSSPPFTHFKLSLLETGIWLYRILFISTSDFLTLLLLVSCITKIVATEKVA